MDKGRTPKQLLFGQLMQSRPFHGPKKRWHDEVVGDLHAMSVGDEWFRLCQIVSSGQRCVPELLKFWHKTEGQLITCAANVFSNIGTFYCVCGRCFRRKGDLTRHCNFCGASNLLLVQEESQNFAIMVHCSVGSCQVTKCVCV